METSPASRLADFLEMIKFSHTVFAMPFAVAAAVLAANGRGPSLATWCWIIVAVAAARTAAMTWNRVADRELDAANPRTAERHLVTGRLSVGFAVAATLVASALFFLAAWRLNPLALALSPFVLGWLLAYSYTKRFTALSHAWLGASLGLAPIGAWIAVRGSILDEPGVPFLLAATVVLWTAGFDVIYACQDEGVDREHGLHSLPARMGARGALRVAAFLHVLMVVTLAALAAVAPGLGFLTWVGIAAVAALLVYEHSLVRPGDLSRVNVAFFLVNGAVSILLGAILVADQLL